MAVAIPLLIQVGIAVATHYASKAFAKKPNLKPVDRGRFDDIRVQTAEEGAFRPLAFGRRVRLAGNIIWGTTTKEYISSTPGRSGGKGGGGGAAERPTNNYSYKKSFAILFCSSPVKSYRRITENFEVIYNNSGSEVFEGYYEAEGAALAGGAVVVDDATMSGGRGVRLAASSHKVTFAVEADRDGLHTLSIVYKNSSPTSVEVRVNGSLQATVSLPAQSTPSTATATLTLVRGANQIEVKPTAAQTTDVDRIYVSATGVSLPPRPERVPTHIVDPDAIYPADPNDPGPYYNLPSSFNPSGYAEGYVASGGQARLEIFAGRETQPQSAIIVAREGVDETPAWRDDSYIAFEDYLVKEGQLGNFVAEIEPEIQDLAEILKYLYKLDDKVTDSDLDFSALAGTVPDGFVLDHRSPLEEWVSSLERWFNFDVVDRGGKIVAVKRGGATVATICERELRARRSGEARPRAAVKVTNTDPVDLPAAVDVVYLDPAPSKDFHAGNQTARRQVGSSFDVETLSFPIVGDANTAHAVGLRYLDTRHLEARPMQFTAGFKFRYLIPTDIVEVVMEDGAIHTLRVTAKQSDLQSAVRFTAVPERASIYTQKGTGYRGRGQESPPVKPPANTLLLVADAPPVRQSEVDRLALIVAGTPRGVGSWQGAFLHRKDRNNEYEQIGALERPATIGIVESASNTTTTVGFDRTRSFTVKLYYNGGGLESRTEDELLRERLNLALYGQGNRWEVLQVISVTPQTSSAPYVAQYLVTGTRSGLFGTEEEAAQHQANDLFVLIDDAVSSVPLRIDDLNRERTFIAQSVGQVIADAEQAASVALTVRGNSLRPPAPADGIITRDVAGNILATWRARSREFRTFRPNTPQDQMQAETFDVEVMDALDSVVLDSFRVRAGGHEQVLWNEPGASAASGGAQTRKTTPILPGGGVGTANLTVAADGSLAATTSGGIEGGSGYVWTRSTQVIEPSRGRFYCEFTVPASGKLPVAVGLERYVAHSEPLNPLKPHFFEFFFGQEWSGGGSLGSWVEHDCGSAGFTGPVSLSIVAGDRLGIEVDGGQVRYYKNRTSEASAPIYVSGKRAEGLYRLAFWAWGQGGETTGADKPRLVLPAPSFVYTASQQTARFGGLQSTINLRVYQVNPVVGRGKRLKVTG